MPTSPELVSPFRGYRFPLDIITHAVWLYHRFALRHHDTITVSEAGDWVEMGELAPDGQTCRPFFRMTLRHQAEER